jgi:hypothetical protein
MKYSNNCLLITPSVNILLAIFAIREYSMTMTKGQDILVLLKLLAGSAKGCSYLKLGEELGMSPSEVHAAVGRLALVGLLNKDDRIPNRQAVREFLVHGLKYVFPLIRKGGICRGIPTAQGAPFAQSAFALNDDPPPVWPEATAKVRGLGTLPIYSSAPKASLRDPDLYKLLILCDLLRGGQARERAWAEQQLDKHLAEEQK